MKAKYHSKYNTVDKNSNGIVMFRYIVSGTEEQLAAYKKAQGDYYRENEEGQPMFFTPRFISDNLNLLISSKGKVFADTAELDKLNSLVNQYPGALGNALAQIGANKILGQTQSAGAVAVTAPVDKTEKLDD